MSGTRSNLATFEQLGMDDGGRCDSVSEWPVRPACSRHFGAGRHEECRGAVAGVAQKLNEQPGKTALMIGAQFALRHIDEPQKQPQREMIAKL